MTQSVTGEAEGEIRHLVPDVETLAQRLASVDYLVDEGLATAIFLSLRRRLAGERREQERDRASEPSV